MTALERIEFDKKFNAAKKAKAKKKNLNLQTANATTLPPAALEVDEDDVVGEDRYVVKGYVGKAKGILQVLYERGLYQQNMHGKITQTTINERFVKGKVAQDPANDAFAVLDACRDFTEETTQLEELFVSRGHILVSSVKCHPEMAGCGIEYSWGKLKMEFRKMNRTIASIRNGRNTERNLRDIITQHLPIERVWRFERKTRDYRRLYLKLAEDREEEHSEMNFESLEKMRVEYRTHRNIAEIENKFISSN
jgi:uncharacterized DUF497 family protein